MALSFTLAWALAKPWPAGAASAPSTPTPQAGPKPLAAPTPSGQAIAAATEASRTGIVAVRLWPAREYTRLTLESQLPLQAKFGLTDAPWRMTVDLDGVELDNALRSLVGKVRPDDPFIAGIRVAQYQPRVVRLVFDLKQQVRPEQFTLLPIAPYRHRLIFDLYPLQEADPLLALLREREAAASSASLGDRPLSRVGASAAASGPSAASPPSGSSTPSAPSAPSSSPTSSPSSSPSPGPKPPAAQSPAVPTIAVLPQARASSPVPPAFESASASPGRTPAPAASSAVAATPARQASAAASAPTATGTPATTDRTIVVVLDPGHGGEDPGAIGPTGLREKDVVLAVALELREKLNTLPGLRCVLTRDDDYFVPLHERVRKARRVQADLFVSIHADAFMKPQARGASVFALSTRGASSAAARWMAERENAADQVGGLNIGKVRDSQILATLLDMSTTAQIKDSLKLAHEVLGTVGRIGKLHSGHVEQAGFAVLKAPDIPSILVETAFISNPEEEAKLRDQGFRRQLVGAMASGIRRYFAKNPALARRRA